MHGIGRKFLEPEGGQGGGEQQNGGTGQQAGTGQPAVDYAKIQQMLEGTLKAKEDTALKAYFKQQGLTEEEVSRAIADFKNQKAQNQPDIQAVQGQLTDAKNQLAQAQAAAQQAQLESAAVMMAASLGMDAKIIPYVLKMADLSKTMGQDGKINEETMKTALNQVLEDVPALKPKEKGSEGFIRLGAAGPGSQGQAPDGEATLRDAVSEALKK